GQTLREARRATLRKIIRFRVRDYRRDKARFHRMKLKLSWTDSAAAEPSVEVRVLAKERYTQLHAALEQIKGMALSYPVVSSYSLRETPMEEVAAPLSIPVNTAWSRWQRGRDALREALEEMEKPAA